MAKKKYTGTVTLRTARPRSRRLRELGIGGAVTISTTTGGSSSESSDTSAYASEAGHAAEADHATSADTAKNLTEDSSDWEAIDKKDEATLDKAKKYADQTKLSKKADDIAEGFLTFLQGIAIGPDGAWGWVRKTGDVVKSWFKNLWTDILTVTNYLTGEGGLLTLKGNVSIAKDTPNGRNGNLSVAGTTTSGAVRTDDLRSNQFKEGLTDGKGFGLWIDEHGLAHFEADIFTARMKAVFQSLEIRELSYVGGNWLFSPAGSRVVRVLAVDSAGTAQDPSALAPADTVAWRCCFLAKDEERAVRNWFKVGDQCRCQTFNLDSHQSGQPAENRYYWRTAVAVGQFEASDDGKTYNYVDLSNAASGHVTIDGVSCEAFDALTASLRLAASSTPQAGDSIAVQGSQTNRDRQNAIEVVVEGDSAVNIYSRIDSYGSLADRITFKLSPSGTVANSAYFTVISGDSTMSLDEYVSQFAGKDGEDGISGWLEPSELLITETVSGSGTSMTKDLDMWNGNVMATAKASKGDEVVLAVITKITFDNTVFAPYIDQSDPSRIFFGGRDTMLGSSERKVEVYADFTATFSDGTSKSFSRQQMVYINRLGTLYSKTFGDVTNTIRTREFWDESGRVIAFKSDVTDAADRFSRTISQLPLSRNLLLNSDFAALAETSNGCIRLVPTTYWQGYQQESRNAQGEWVNKLTGGATYTLSFYARGKGRVGAIVHHTLLVGDTSQGNQNAMLENLTPRLKFYTMEFTPSVDCPFRVMLGSNSYGQGELPGTEIYISRPKLVKNSAQTTNLLTNSLLANVTGGVPQGWMLWDNLEGGSAAPVTIRDIVPELFPPGTPIKWERWTNGDTGLSPLLSVGNLEDGVYPIIIAPRSYWNGIVQRSYVRGGMDGWGGGAKVLKHDAWYTLSFEAKRSLSGVRAGFIIDCVNLKSGSDQFGNTVGGAAMEWDLTTSWKRYTYKFKAQANYDTSATDTDGYGFSLMLGLVNAISGSYTNNIIQIRRPQLEEGETATEWRRGEESGEMMNSLFEQTAEKISMLVRKGEKVGGIKITETGTTLYGEQTVVEGDLDLQGLTTENVTWIDHDIDPLCINMGALSGVDAIKSVQVKALNTTFSTDTMIYETPPRIVLPFYDSAYSSWWNSRFGGIPRNAAGGFLLTDDSGVPDLNRCVAEWKKNGTRLTIANEVDIHARNWQEIRRWSWNTPEDAWNESHRNTIRHLISRALVVCSDGRIIASGNLSAASPYSANNGNGGEETFDKAGRFSCGGYSSRFIIVLPGQSLQLRSQLLTIDSSGREVLVWVVENPSEFAPLTFPFYFYQDGQVATYVKSNGSAAFSPYGEMTAVREVILGADFLSEAIGKMNGYKGYGEIRYFN